MAKRLLKMDAKIIIISWDNDMPKNPVDDWCGEWNKSEVIQEMKDLGIKADNPDEEWLDYVFDHVFDDPGFTFPSNVIESIKISKTFKAKFKIKDVMVSIDYRVIEE